MVRALHHQPEIPSARGSGLSEGFNRSLAPPPEEPKESFTYRAARGTTGVVFGTLGALLGAPMGAYKGAVNPHFDVNSGPETRKVVRGLTGRAADRGH